MKRFVFAILITAGVLIAAGYYLYRTLMPDVIASAVVSETVPDYIPKRLKHRVEQIRKPINRGTEAMLQEMHGAGVPVDDVLEVVDGITEAQTHSFLDDFERSKPRTTDEVFDLAVKHFPTDFDPEIFRKPFNEHFDMKQIRKAVSYANLNRKSNDVDIVTAKAIVKNIIIQKDKEMKN